MIKFYTIEKIKDDVRRRVLLRSDEPFRLTPLAREFVAEESRKIGGFNMRMPLFVANWKMNKGPRETAEFIKLFLAEAGNVTDREIMIAPPFTSLAAAAALLDGSRVRLAAQNCHFETKGAFTGEISADFLKETGVYAVIIGHSERRQYFGETDEMINKKLNTLLAAGLKPILCVGETLAERERNITMDIIGRQLKSGLAGLTVEKLANVVVAYEPVWAIGTGKTATPEIAQEVHGFIRKQIEIAFGVEGAVNTRILYGGSVTPENIAHLMKEKDIDGGLVGGASLKPDTFAKLVRNS